jgi:hypothetical protein
MLSRYSTKLVRPPAPGSPVRVCPTCGVRGHVIAERASHGVKHVIAGCRCGQRRAPEPSPQPSEGTHHA